MRLFLAPPIWLIRLTGPPQWLASGNVPRNVLSRMVIRSPPRSTDTEYQRRLLK
jgi:hypothetical protein